MRRKTNYLLSYQTDFLSLSQSQSRLRQVHAQAAGDLRSAISTRLPTSSARRTERVATWDMSCIRRGVVADGAVMSVWYQRSQPALADATLAPRVAKVKPRDTLVLYEAAFLPNHVSNFGRGDCCNEGANNSRDA